MTKTRRRNRRKRGGCLTKTKAYQLLFGRRKTIASVWRWLGRLGIPLCDRADAVQQVLLAAHRSWRRYKPWRARPERWLNRIAVHFSDHYARMSIHRIIFVSIDEAEDILDESPGPDEVLIGSRERTRVLAWLQALEPHLRALIVANQLDGIPMAACANKLGIPISTAYKWRRRGMDALRDVAEAEGDGDGSEPGPASHPREGDGDGSEPGPASHPRLSQCAEPGGVVLAPGGSCVDFPADGGPARRAGLPSSLIQGRLRARLRIRGR